MKYFLVSILLLTFLISLASNASPADDSCERELEPNEAAKREAAVVIARMLNPGNPILRMSLPLFPYQDDLDIGDRLVRIGIIAKGANPDFNLPTNPDMFPHTPSNTPPVQWFAVSDDASRVVMTFHRSYFEAGMDGEEKSLHIFVADISAGTSLKHNVEFSLPHYGEAIGGTFTKQGHGLIIQGRYSRPTETGREDTVLEDLYFYQLVRGRAQLTGRLSQLLGIVIQQVQAVPNNNPRLKTYKLTLAAGKVSFMAIAVDTQSGQIEVLSAANLDKPLIYSEDVKILIGSLPLNDFDVHESFVAQAVSGQNQEPSIEIYPLTLSRGKNKGN